MWAAVIPDGPLHPDDALAALVIGLLVGAVLGRRREAIPAIVIAAGLTLEWRHPGMLVDGLVDRPSPLWAAAGAGVAAGMASIAVSGRLTLHPRSAVALAVVGCGAVWATTPDTEPALVGGAVLVAAMPFLGRASIAAGVAFVVPVVAAVVGTVGRVDRLGLVLVAMSGVIGIGRAMAAVIGRWAAQRAGTPTTVAPGATSVVTTAPAPTTAP